ncbi:uncharacterized protein (DUF111 family) [Kocuria palustris]|jgi:uncharacterized protein (DUF111 family)
MKRGRPAQTLHALVQVDQVDGQAQRVLGLTGSLGVRHAPVERVIRTRSFEEIEIDGQRIAVKVACDEAGEVRRAEPEFRDVARAAETLGRATSGRSSSRPRPRRAIFWVETGPRSTPGSAEAPVEVGDRSALPQR